MIVKLVKNKKKVCSNLYNITYIYHITAFYYIFNDYITYFFNIICTAEEKLSPFAMLLQKKKEEEAKNSSENKFNNTNVYNNNESNKSPGNNITNNTNLNSNNNHNKFSPDINFNSYDYNTNNNKENILNDDDIKEEILVDNINNEKEEGEKDKSSSLHNYTSSQTFGYDNSVTSYNLDFYDYTEDVEIER